MSEPAIRCRGLSVSYPSQPVVADVDFEVAPGECLAIIGESGSGKSTILRALLGIQGESCQVSGSVLVNGVEVIGASQPALRALRGTTIGFLGQDPYGAYDPLMSVRANVAESWQIKGREPGSGEVATRLQEVGISNATDMIRLRPLAWSGGMLQRAQVVAATALHPSVVLADEPTSALDAANARRVLSTLRAEGAAVLLVSHDWAVVTAYADRVLELADGRLRPADPSGVAPRASGLHRLPRGSALLEAHGVALLHPGGGGLAPLDLTLHRGVVHGIRGESGSGKSTLLRVLAGIDPPTSGRLHWDVEGRPTAAFIQQDARGSLNPRWPVSRIIAEPLNPRLRDRHRPDVSELLRSVGLDPSIASRPGGSLSGGQAQRVAIARAVMSQAPLVLADEPTAALDPDSARSALRLLRGLAADGRAVVVVSHDEEVLSTYCDTMTTLHPPQLHPPQPQALGPE